MYQESKEKLIKILEKFPAENIIWEGQNPPDDGTVKYFRDLGKPVIHISYTFDKIGRDK